MALSVRPAVPRALALPYRAARRHPWLALAALGIAAHLRVLVVVFSHPRPPMWTDAAIFQHAGWYVLRGGRLYLDVWEPKPPLPYETTALLALISGDDPYLHHALSVTVTVAASVATMLLVARLARRLTGRRDAALLAGTSLLLLPGYAYLPAFGFNPKYLVALCGLLAVWLALSDRPVLAGVAAAASAGYWQLAIVFPALVVAVAARRGSAGTVARTVLGGGIATAAVLAPVVYWNAVPAMLAETVVIPLVVPEPGGPIPTADGLTDAAYGLVVVLLAIPALAGMCRAEHRDEWWWVVAGGGWFALVAVAVDYDNYPDAIPGLVFVALALAFLYATRPHLRRGLATAVLAVVTVNVVFLGGFGIAIDPLAIPDPPPLAEIKPYPIPGDGIVTDVKVLFWEQRVPETCHYRMSALEYRWLRLAGYDPRCGRLAEALALLVR